MTNLLYRNNSSVTVHNKCYQIPPPTSTPFATHAWRSCVVRLSWSAHFFMQPAASKMLASGSPWCIYISFVMFVLHPTPKEAMMNRNGRTMHATFEHHHLSNHSELGKCSYELFLTMTDIITSQITDISSWITLYKETAFTYTKHCMESELIW